jgi:hypothetical protein
VKIHTVLFVILGAACTLMSCFWGQRGGSKEQVDLSREAFIREMVIASETETTEHFNDYTPGSYHVKKLDLIKGVSNLSDSTTKSVDAVLIIGPSGPLWQYNVITVIDTLGADSPVSVNRIVFPHARITHKSTKELEREVYRQIIERVQANPLLRNVTDEDGTDASEWAHSIMIAEFGRTKSIRVVRDSVADQYKESLELLYEAVNEMIGGDRAVVTYD